MNSILRNCIAVFLGLIIGGWLNMQIIKVSGSIIPPPEGANLMTTEGLKAAMHLMEPKHFLFPFLAHALGTFVGALITAAIAASHQIKLALLIGGIFMIGGISMIVMLPSPIWFTIVDLVGAYLPMGYLAGKFVERRREK